MLRVCSAHIGYVEWEETKALHYIDVDADACTSLTIPKAIGDVRTQWLRVGKGEVRWDERHAYWKDHLSRWWLWWFGSTTTESVNSRLLNVGWILEDRPIRWLRGKGLNQRLSSVDGSVDNFMLQLRKYPIVLAEAEFSVGRSVSMAHGDLVAKNRDFLIGTPVLQDFSYAARRAALISEFLSYFIQVRCWDAAGDAIGDTM